MKRTLFFVLVAFMAFCCSNVGNDDGGVTKSLDTRLVGDVWCLEGQSWYYGGLWFRADNTIQQKGGASIVNYIDAYCENGVVCGALVAGAVAPLMSYRFITQAEEQAAMDAATATGDNAKIYKAQRRYDAAGRGGLCRFTIGGIEYDYGRWDGVIQPTE